jgi:hypothetical protein
MKSKSQIVDSDAANLYHDRARPPSDRAALGRSDLIRGKAAPAPVSLPT